MQGLARILVIGKDSDNDKKLAETLKKGGFECSISDITQSVAELSGTRRPDVVVLNMQSSRARKDPEIFLALAKTLKNSALSSRMRIMIVGTDRAMELNASAADIDDLLIGPVNPAQICHRLSSLVRLNTMHEELVRRLNTSAKYGSDAPPAIAEPGSVNNATVMVFGDPTQFAMIEHSLAKQATLVGALSEETALDYLTRRDFDAVIINAAADTDTYVSFLKNVRRRTRLFNLPVLMLADRGELSSCEPLYKSGITDVIAKPYAPEELKLRVNLLVRESRFRSSLKEIYQQAKHLATSDSLTGLYSRGFLLEHVSAMVTDANRTSQSFSLASLSISNIQAINTELGYVAGDRIIRQIGEVISYLIRGEDLAARYSGSKFIIALPDTTQQQARYAIQRINGVISHTEFVVDGYYAPVMVSLSTTLVSFQQGDTAESLIGRTHSVDLRVAA